jgi:hypothetical protein
MKAVSTPHRYVSGPHSSDYYLLLDEQSGYIFTTRLAEHIREASSMRDERAGLTAASLLEMWIDDSEMHVWYVFEAHRSDGAGSTECNPAS